MLTSRNESGKQGVANAREKGGKAHAYGLSTAPGGKVNPAKGVEVLRRKALERGRLGR